MCKACKSDLLREDKRTQVLSSCTEPRAMDPSRSILALDPRSFVFHQFFSLAQEGTAAFRSHR
jgi:hypothetical protein